MTALKPIENRLVRGVPSSRYPLNELCAMPDCGDLTADPHHCFPRSMIGNDSWFVEINEGPVTPTGIPLPHVVGLCRMHHDDVEEHRAWIKLEEDGRFVWYDRLALDVARRYEMDEWVLAGDLDPQPGRGEKSRKPRRLLRGEERRQRKRISIALPDDWEDGGALWDELIEDTKDWLYEEGVFGDRGRIPIAEALFAMHYDWVTCRTHSPKED